MSYIEFNLRPDLKKKTLTWGVLSGNVCLGLVKWYAQWRKYCFFPYHGSLYDPSCLRDIADFCELQTRSHKEAWLEKETG